MKGIILTSTSLLFISNATYCQYSSVKLVTPDASPESVELTRYLCILDDIKMRQQLVDEAISY
jgi:hypothetical protein